MDIVALTIAGVATWMLRASFIAFAANAELPPFADRMMQNARHAALAGLVAGALVAGGHGSVVAIPLPWLVAATMAAVVATRTRNLGSIAAAGMVTLWAIEAAAALA